MTNTPELLCGGESHASNSFSNVKFQLLFVVWIFLGFCFGWGFFFGLIDWLVFFLPLHPRSKHFPFAPPETWGVVAAGSAPRTAPRPPPLGPGGGHPEKAKVVKRMGCGRWGFFCVGGEVWVLRTSSS